MSDIYDISVLRANKFSKFSGYIIGILKSVAFLYINKKNY